MYSNVGDDFFIVLFNSSKVGMVVSSNENWELGLFSDNWAMNCFVDYQGDLILKND